MIRSTGLPLLPGNSFNQNCGKTKFHKSQHFEYSKNIPILAERPKPGIGGIPLVGSSTNTYTAVFSKGRISQVPPWLAFDKHVLYFDAFFKETAQERRGYTFRIRQCKIAFYLEDGTTQVTELKIPNSGLNQGTLISRQLIKMPPPRETDFYTVLEFNIGQEVELYSKKFMITNCDNFTRTFLNRCGIYVPDPIDTPTDPYSELRVKMDTEYTVSLPSRKSKRMVHQFDQFLRFDRKLLNFQAYWDDRETIGGFMHLLSVRFYLADDTMEIIEHIPPNSGRDYGCFFLSRSKLPMVIDNELSYNSCVVEVNERHEHLLRMKTDVLQQVQDLIEQSDEVIKTVTVVYFQIQQTVTAPWPNQFQILSDTSRLYEPGSQNTEFMNWLLTSSNHDKDTLQITDTIEPATEQSTVELEQEQERKLAESIDSEYLFQENFYLPISGHAASKASETHTFRNLKTPARCRECDSYVYFQGVDCSECGLSCHKKCLFTLAIQCGHKRLPSKMTTFGIDLGQHLTETTALVPHIICKCVDEIESRGKLIKGIYRVSGVKSRVEKLCQAFENGADLVDLTDIHPNVISNVLKLYLRQLPEPLLTLQLYPEFVKIAREFPSNCTEDVQAATDLLKTLVKKLPRHHYLTLALLMQHLKRISDESAVNNMPPSNLGIVFGPTLLRTSEGSASLSSLVDTIHQTRAIELMIQQADNIFCAREIARARDYGADWGGKSELIGFGLYRSFSFMDRWKKPNELPDLCKLKMSEKSTTLPETVKKMDLVEMAGHEQRSESESDDELTYFLLKGDHSRSKISHTSNTPKIFKGSLKDYQGLEGVSLTLLGSSQSSEGTEYPHQKLGKSISDTAPNLHERDGSLAREGSSTSETVSVGHFACMETNKLEEWTDPGLHRNAKPFPKLGLTSKTKLNKQCTESSVDSDYSFESHASSSVESRSCDSFLEPPSISWSRSVSTSHEREKDHLDYFAYIPVYQTHPNREDSSNFISSRTTSLDDQEINTSLKRPSVGAREEQTSSLYEASTSIDTTFTKTSFQNSFRQIDQVVDVAMEIPTNTSKTGDTTTNNLQSHNLTENNSSKCHKDESL